MACESCTFVDVAAFHTSQGLMLEISLAHEHDQLREAKLVLLEGAV